MFLHNFVDSMADSTAMLDVLQPNLRYGTVLLPALECLQHVAIHDFLITC